MYTTNSINLYFEIFMNSPDLQNMIAHLPGLVFFKNTDLIYTAVSGFAARLCGFDKAEQFCGHNDFELRCSAADSAMEFRAEDRRVMTSGKEISSLQINQFADGNIHIFFLRKTPLFDASGKIIGVCSQGSEVTNPAIGKAIFNLLESARINQLQNQIFTVATNDDFDRLSVREAEVIFYFMRGFTNKEIGDMMTLSPRTIESYLESIKSKMNCQSRQELLLQCMHNGFSYIIPQSILRRCMNKTIAWQA
jgi:DNA-binding CsgD family transcriptional regulator